MRVSKGHLGESHPLVRCLGLTISQRVLGKTLSRWVKREKEPGKVEDEKYTVVGR